MLGDWTFHNPKYNNAVYFVWQVKDDSLNNDKNVYKLTILELITEWDLQ